METHQGPVPHGAASRLPLSSPTTSGQWKAGLRDPQHAPAYSSFCSQRREIQIRTIQRKAGGPSHASTSRTELAAVSKSKSLLPKVSAPLLPQATCPVS